MVTAQVPTHHISYPASETFSGWSRTCGQRDKMRKSFAVISYTSQVNSVAQAACTILDQIGVKTCIVGGLACKLHGNTREPGDIDILCLTAFWSQESLKRVIVRGNSNFYLIPSRDPTATYQVLWHRYPRIKVDILVPGVMDIPMIPTSTIVHRVGLPVAPLSMVFLLKLQAWSQHRASVVSRFNQKQFTDQADIMYLLPILARQDIKPHEDSSLPSSFRGPAISRVQAFVKQFPHSAEEWRRIGYQVASSSVSSSRTGRFVRFN